MTSIVIPENVTSIGEYAFQSCDALTSVTIFDLSAWCKIDFNGFFSSPLLYGAKLYLNDQLLTELTIPEDITKIKGYAFLGCSSIKKVNISDNVTSIGNYAFYDCDALTSIIIPNNVTSIGNYAFENCEALTSVTIGSGVTFIGKYAFSQCHNLSVCYCYATKTPGAWDSERPFYEIKSGAVLYVPIRCKASYESHNWTQDFSVILEMD